MKSSKIFLSYFLSFMMIGLFTSPDFLWFSKAPATTIIIVRHADRQGHEDRLNADGKERAQELSNTLLHSGIEAIYSTDKERTTKTAQPIADHLGISLTLYEANDLESLVKKITTSHKGKTILVVGHSNTVPQTVNKLGITPQLSDIPHDVYDNIYIVTLGKRTVPELLKLKYGQKSETNH